MGPYHACNGPHLIKDCNESTCGRCKLNLDNHTPSKCSRKFPFNRQQSSNPSHNTSNSNRNQINNHTEPNLQLSISTKKPNHMVELLEATRKMAKYFKTSYKHSKPHLSDNTNCHIIKIIIAHLTQTHKCKSHINNDKVNEVINSTCTSNNTPTEPKNSKEHHDSESSYSIFDSSLDLK